MTLLADWRIILIGHYYLDRRPKIASVLLLIRMVGNAVGDVEHVNC